MHRRCRVLRPTGFPPGGAGGEWVDLREKPTVRGERSRLREVGAGGETVG